MSKLPPVCFDCGRSCVLTLVCAGCVEKRIARDGSAQWLNYLVGEVKKKFPDADMDGKKNTNKDTIKKPKSKAQLKREAKEAKPVHLSWFD